MDDNPYQPGTIYEVEPKPRSMNWLIKSSMAAFLLAMLSMIVTQACLTWSFFDRGDLEGRMRVASYPMKVAVGLCLLGFVLLIAGLFARKRAVEPDE